MQLKERDGILCDRCGMTFKHDFTYYSFDFRRVVVCGNQKPSLDSIFHLPVDRSIDVCSNCYDKFAVEVVKNYSKISSNVRKVRVEVVCEYSGVVLAGSYTYYYTVVTKVVVKLSNQPKTCMQCRTQYTNKDTVCPKCKNDKSVRVATVRPMNRILEVNISEKVYDDFIALAAVAKNSQGQWTTQS